MLDHAKQFLIRLRPAPPTPECDPRRLTLEVEAQVDCAIYAGSTIDIDHQELHSLLLDPDNKYGLKLGAYLCESPCVNTIMTIADTSTGNRVQMMLEGEGPHHGIRWERLELPAWKSVAVESKTPFSRFAAVNQMLQEPQADAQFHLLLVIASPDGLPEIDADAQCRSVVESCARLLEGGQIESR